MSNWLVGAGLLFLLGTLASIWTYRRISQRSAAHHIAWGLKILALLILVLCLTEPIWTGKIAAAGQNYFVILADNSASMTVRDKDGAASRAQAVQDVLNPETAAWLATLEEHFQVRQYLFDDSVRRLEDFTDLDYRGPSSLIQNSLEIVTRRYQERPLAGIILLTDGNATDIQELHTLSDSLPPVYPVIVGSEQSTRDLALSKVTINQTSFETAPVTIQAQVSAHGFDGKTIQIELYDQDEQVVESQTQVIDTDRQKHTFRFRVQPKKPGVAFYRLAAAEKTKPSAAPVDPLAPPDTGEATLANNSRTIVVNRPEEPFRVLYVTGRPNWEYKFLQRALAEDEQVHLVGYIRVARREPKYNWLGHRGETSNPLYRGFDRQQAEQTEQYDQPVIVRLNVEDEKELLDGFPVTPEQLYKYHAVIFDDVDSSFFTYDQMNLIRRFVSERGGGFMMLGGKESFREGDFENTPIAYLLPIYLDSADPPPPATPINYILTREGWLQPWARLYENEDAEKNRLMDMPDFRVLNLAPSVKPGAGVIATAGENSEGSIPGLMVQRYGNGRVAALTIGDIWRWGLKRPEFREDMNRFWRQTIRWLVADVPRRISLQAHHQPDQINQPVELQISVRDNKFESMDNLDITVDLRDPDGDIVRLYAQPVLNESGLYHTTYIPRTDGPHLARAVVNNTDPENPIEPVETGFATDLEAQEFNAIGLNRPLLETLAQKTAGRVVTPDQLARLARDLPRREAPIMEMQVKPLWDLPGLQPTLFAVLFITLIIEWTLRRRRGLP